MHLQKVLKINLVHENNGENYRTRFDICLFFTSLTFGKVPNSHGNRL